MKRILYLSLVAILLAACNLPSGTGTEATLKDSMVVHVCNALPDPVTLCNDTITPYTYSIGDNVYPIYITPQGRCYVMRTAKNGSQYKQHLSEEICLQICKELNLEYK